MSREQAADVIFGFCVANDVSVRDWQLATSQFMLGKSFDTHAPFGPWIVTPDEVGDPQRLAIYGEVLSTQNGHISLRVPKSDTARIITQMLAELPISDVSIEDPPIEDAIEQIFATPDDSKVMKAIAGD